MARSRTSFGAVFTALRLATRPGGPSLWARVSALPRLVRATAKGAYQDTPASQLALMVGALAYLITPVDLMPEALLGPFGLLDDRGVIVCKNVEQTAAMQVKLSKVFGPLKEHPVYSVARADWETAAVRDGDAVEATHLMSGG